MIWISRREHKFNMFNLPNSNTCMKTSTCQKCIAKCIVEVTPSRAIRSNTWSFNHLNVKFKLEKQVFCTNHHWRNEEGRRIYTPNPKLGRVWSDWRGGECWGGVGRDAEGMVWAWGEVWVIELWVLRHQFMMTKQDKACNISVEKGVQRLTLQRPAFLWL